MFLSALKNLLHQKTRFVIAALGVTIAVVLITAQAGLFLGFQSSAGTIVDHVDADIWVTSQNSRSFDFANPFPERKVNQLLGIKGVASVEKLVLLWGSMKTPEGGPSRWRPPDITQTQGWEGHGACDKGAPRT